MKKDSEHSKDQQSYDDNHKNSALKSENQQKKKIPHSIEELLKTPNRSSQSSLLEHNVGNSAIASYHSILFQPPCGILVDKPCTCNFLTSVSTTLQVHPASSISRDSNSS